MSESPHTLPQALAMAARTARGVSFWGSTGTYLRLGFAELAERADRVAEGLAAAGLSPGDRVLVQLPTGPELLAALYGCLRAGVLPAAVAPPASATHPGPRRLAALAERIDARAVLAPAPTPGLDLALLTPSALEAHPATQAPLPQDPEAPAVLQFTSGSTATPRAVILSHRALLTNCAQIAAGVAIEPGDVMVSWLPLFHDMGFLAAVSSPIALGLELVLAAPQVFLRDPLSWLRAIDEHRGTHCGAPSFAYRYLLARSARSPLPELDLSCWRAACVGAEPIHGPTLREFAARFAPCGLSSNTLTPCYGLAEATLALTMKPWGSAPRSVSVDRAALARGQVEFAEHGVELPSSGAPLPGVELSIHDPQGAALPGLRVGEIWARSPALFSGYWGTPPLDGPLRSGDRGFLHEGELFVTGRIKEAIILRGENHAPAEIEWAAEVEGVRAGRVVAFGRPNPEAATEDLVLVAEVERGQDPKRLTLAIRQAVFARTGLAVNDLELVPRGTLPVTTSGKLRRTAVAELVARLRADA